MVRSDSICALASGVGRAGVAVIRVSGPSSRMVLESLAGISAPRPRLLSPTRLRDPTSGATIDRGLAVFFPGPASYTGEDVAELHIHGGLATVKAVMEALTQGLGVRLAEPGEFTRRAFENGKMDLTAAEAIADLVAAETEAQRRQALRQLEGGLADLYQGWSDRLTRQLAHLEAHIDFPDEDLPEGVMDEVLAATAMLREEIGEHLADNRRGERLRSGVRIAIVGPPNVGKSSLLNTLAQRDVAIVAETAGTTRDVIEAHLDLGGFPVTIADTAGLRIATDAVEREGVRRGLARAKEADFVIVMLEATDLRGGQALVRSLIGEATLLVVNKIDLVRLDPVPEIAGMAPIAISAVTEEGISGLLDQIQSRVGALLDTGSTPALTHSRHRQALETCRDSLARAVSGNSAELVAEDLRLAVRALGRITGRVGVEDLLDVIFRDFCIGK